MYFTKIENYLFIHGKYNFKMINTINISVFTMK